MEGFTKHFLRLALIDERSDVGGFKKDLSNILSEFFYSPHPPSAARAFFRAINQGARNGIRFPSDLALFGKAILTTEGWGFSFIPNSTSTGSWSRSSKSVAGVLEPAPSAAERRNRSLRPAGTPQRVARSR